MSLFDSPGNLGGRADDPRLINPLLAPPGAHGRWGAPGAPDPEPIGHVGDEAGRHRVGNRVNRRGVGYEPDRPTGGGNFNPDMRIDLSHIAAPRTPPPGAENWVKDLPPYKQGQYIPKTPPPPAPPPGTGGGLGGASRTPPPPPGTGGSGPVAPLIGRESAKSYIQQQRLEKLAGSEAQSRIAREIQYQREWAQRAAQQQLDDQWNGVADRVERAWSDFDRASKEALEKAFPGMTFDVNSTRD